MSKKLYDITLREHAKVLDKLEQRIATLEKVIGKLQLRLGDVVLYIDKKAEHNEWKHKIL